MSRRTKLCITALFLVLLAIPVVYLVLTWSPAPPLQFRIVRDTGETYLAGYANPVRVYEVEMRNTSLAPIHFRVGDVTWDHAALERSLDKRQWLPYAGSLPPVYCIGYFDLEASHHLSDMLPACHTFPARSTQMCRLMVLEKEAPGLSVRPHFLVCSWMSQTKLRILKFLTWLRPELPPSLQFRLSLPGMQETITRIDATALSNSAH